jgi:DNA-binding protein YbaB
MFKGLGGIGNFASMMGGLQQLPEKLQQVNGRMQQEVLRGTAGEGAVVVEVNGLGEMQGIECDPAAHDPQALQIWIVEASNAAHAAAKQRFAEAIREVSQELGLNVPGMDGALHHLTGGGG